MIDVVFDSFLDTIKTLPFLLGAYLLIEWIAHRAGSSFKGALKKMGVFGSLGGAFLGLVPQCGFSVAAASFYADRIITPGTLLAVFIATSDEAIPIMLANPGSGNLIFRLLGYKLVIAVVIGMVVDVTLRKIWKPVWDEDSELQHDHVHMKNMAFDVSKKAHVPVQKHTRVQVKKASVKRDARSLDLRNRFDEAAHPHHAGCDHSHCEHCDNQLCEHCCSHTHCHGSIVRTAIEHTIKVSILIFLVATVLNFGFEALGSEKTAALLMNGTVFQPVICALFGLIPSCAASVVLTQLYLEGSIGFGSVLAGLVTGAGTGILILFQAVRNKKEVFLLLTGLFVFGSIVGILFGFL